MLKHKGSDIGKLGILDSVLVDLDMAELKLIDERQPIYSKI